MSGVRLRYDPPREVEYDTLLSIRISQSDKDALGLIASKRGETVAELVREVLGRFIEVENNWTRYNPKQSV